MKSKVSIVKCETYDAERVFRCIKEAVDFIGGIERFVNPGSKVLLKPNLLMAKEPEAGITTHPQVVRGVARLLKPLGCKPYLGDSPSVWGNQIENIDQVYAYTGMKRACEEEGISLIKFEKKRWRRLVPLTTWLDECDYVINIPKLKTHGFTVLTGAIKNLFGLVPGLHKTNIHRNHFEPEEFSRILVDIYEEVRPTLTIVDAITVLEGDGPATSGRVRNLGLILASMDCVALDSVMAQIMGVKPYNVLTTKDAAHRQLGQPDVGLIEIGGENLADVIGEPFLLPATSISAKLPEPVIKLAKQLIRYYPYVEHDHCIRCAACIKACPAKVVSMKGNKITFNYKKCIACFCCQEVCPAAAIKIKRSLLAKLIGL